MRWPNLLDWVGAICPPSVTGALQWGHTSLQEVQGDHSPRPGSWLVLGRLVTGVASQNRGDNRCYHCLSHRALPVPTRVCINEEFVISVLREEGFGVCLFPLSWKAAGSARASWARPPRLVEWVPLSPGTVRTIPRTGSQVSEPVEFSHHILGASKSLTGAGH